MTKPKRQLHPYYDPSKVLGYDAVVNMIVGARGLGKTYSFKKLTVSRNIRAGEEFIYLRRYKTEMAVARDTFFSDVGKEFPEWDFRIHKNMAQRASIESRDDKKRDWITMGYFFALSAQIIIKSASYPKVKRVIYDEFIIEKGAYHYLPNEAQALLNFYKTIDRDTDRVRMYLLANSVSIMNPFFLEWDIEPDRSPELFTKDDGFLLCHFPDSADFADSVANTRFGRFIAGSDYEEYAVKNKFADGNGKLVEKKSPESRHLFALETDKGTFGVWKDIRKGVFYVQEKQIAGHHLRLTMVPESLDGENQLVTYSDRLLAHLRNAFNKGEILFDSAKSRNAFIMIFKR